jgi:predicted phage-related endonuclease
MKQIEDGFPQLNDIVFSAEDVSNRRKSLGGSDSNTLLSGNDEWIHELWQFKTGKVESKNLNDEVHVMMGHWTEPFNARWYQKTTGDMVTHRNHFQVSDRIDYMSANLDGMCMGGTAIWEAKHVNPFSDLEKVIKTYAPQLHHNAYVMNVDKAVLSVFKGTMEYHHFEIDIDKEYQEKLLSIEAEFWECIKKDIPYLDLPEPKDYSVNYHLLKDYDFTGNNKWASLASQLIETKIIAKEHEEAKKEIKKLVPDDAREVTGHGVKVFRSKAGWLAVKI